MSENAVVCENLSVAIGSQEILSELSFTTPSHSLSVVFGPNGAGKSTLLHVLTGHRHPSSGSVSIFGKAPAASRSLIGYVPQFISVRDDYPITVREAVLMGRYAKIGLFSSPSSADSQKVMNALDTVGILSLSEHHVQTLSGGQLQRMMLARALVGEPKLLLLDEATSGVDIGVKESLYELLVRLKQSMAVIFVTHDVSVVSKDVDLILCLNRTLVSHGSPADALTDEAIKCMYGDGVALFSHCQSPHVHVHHHGKPNA